MASDGGADSSLQALLSKHCVEMHNLLAQQLQQITACGEVTGVTPLPQHQDFNEQASKRMSLSAPLKVAKTMPELSTPGSPLHSPQTTPTWRPHNSGCNSRENLAEEISGLEETDDPSSRRAKVVLASESVESKSNCQAKIAQVLSSPAAEYSVALLIICNAGMFGFQADYAVKNPNHDSPAIFVFLNLFFTVAFTLELTLRGIAEGCELINRYNPDVRWNILDIFLVAFSVFEEIYGRMGAGAIDMSSARMLRLLRLVRVVRVIRVLRFFSDLRVMVMGIMSSMKALLWALLLLFIIIYIVSICVLQFVADHIAGKGIEISSLTNRFTGLSMFSSLERCIFTLFMCISGGISWVEVAEPLQDVSPMLAIVLALYVAFSVFCVLNIVTGVFVEKSSTMVAMDEENMMMQELENRKRWLGEIRRLFLKADKDGSGSMEWPEFQDIMVDFKTQICLKNLGLDTGRLDPYHVWQMIDFDGDGQIDISEFAEGLLQLHGTAHAIDIARLRHEIGKSMKQVRELENSTQTMLQQHLMTMMNTPNSISESAKERISESAQFVPFQSSSPMQGPQTSGLASPRVQGDGGGIRARGSDESTLVSRV